MTMKTLFAVSLALLAGVFFSTSLMAAGNKNTDPVKAAIEKSLLKVRPDFAIDRVEKSGIDGLYEVYFVKGGMAYATADGSRLIDGKLYEVQDGKLVDSMEEKLKPMRAKELANVPKDQMIIFSPEGETKAYVNVFTDVDCGYCQKLHSHMAEFNKLGIEVRYLAFPRAGPDSISAKKLASAWCSDDRKDALTKLKLRQTIPVKTCDNPVAAEYALGEKLGVNGTPAMYTKDGSLIGGYLDPNQLVQVLGIH
jgi:thiol:disulfide interchange protein DsbC